MACVVSWHQRVSHGVTAPACVTRHHGAGMHRVASQWSAELHSPQYRSVGSRECGAAFSAAHTSGHSLATTLGCIYDGVLLCNPGWSAMARSWLIATFTSHVQVILLLQPPKVFLCHPGWSAVAPSQLTAKLTSRVKVIFLPQPPEELGLQAQATRPG
ncbi:putative uncharacterized protein SPANXA2-OT1 [Plecturocebus cupreus]